MSESYIQNLFAERIGGVNYGKDTAIYKFEKIKRAKNAVLEANPGAEIIDMGVGEPDEMAFPEVVAKLHEEAQNPDNRGYADNGGQALKEAAARISSKKSAASAESTPAPKCCTRSAARRRSPFCRLPSSIPATTVIMTIPGYPVFGTHAKYYGGQVHNLALTAENNYLPDLDSIPTDVLAKAKVLVLNYPNNPTGASATPEFFAKVVDFAKANNLIVIHDAAYIGLVYDGNKPLSFLATPGAKDVGIELHSTSKNFNMTGWRCGFVVGNPLLVKAYGDVKDNSDSGQFLAIQNAAAYCYDHPEITEAIAAKYSRRMDKLVGVLQNAGFKISKSGGSFFLYMSAAKAAVKADGERVEFENGEALSQWLIREKFISTVPWDDAESAIRFSVTFAAKDEADEDRVINEIASRLGDVKFEF